MIMSDAETNQRGPQIRERVELLRGEGNVAYSEGAFKMAVEKYTAALQLEPRNARLLSNRSAAEAKQNRFVQALEDATALIQVAPKWPKSYSRMAVALHGLKDLEDAYAIYSKGINECAGADISGLQAGRERVFQELLAWDTMKASARQSRFSMDAQREPKGVRIFCVSDLHVDSRGNIEWCRAMSKRLFQEDILIVAGDVADTANGVRTALKELKSRFRRVFYVPGNHDLWIRPRIEDDGRYPDSVCKFLSLLDMCDELGVDVGPAEVAAGVFVVPLFSWYNHTFDEADPTPGDLRFDKFCRWPCSDLDVWRYFLKLNQPRLEQVDAKRQLNKGSRVVTFSHFLPRSDLPFSRGVPGLAKAMGCKELDSQVRAVGSDVHVYGHSHVSVDVSKDGAGGARYVQYALDSEVAGRYAAPYCLMEGGELCGHSAAEWR